MDGANNRRVVAMYPEEYLNPSWSPDGEWIAYTARDEAFKVRADGCEVCRQFTGHTSLAGPKGSEGLES